MNELHQAALARSRRREQMEALIGAYPRLSDNDRDTLIAWYREEASAYDIAMLSNRPEIREGYERFRTEIIEQQSVTEIANFAAILLIIFGSLAALIWMATA